MKELKIDVTNRILKFRAWDGKKIGEYSYGPIQSQFTGLLDKNRKEIFEKDVVSLRDNLTTDDSLSALPNGWFFDESDIYIVVWDDELMGWALQMDTKPDSAENAKYLNHARSLLLDGNVEVIGNIYENPDLIGQDENSRPTKKDA